MASGTYRRCGRIHRHQTRGADCGWFLLRNLPGHPPDLDRCQPVRCFMLERPITSPTNGCHSKGNIHAASLPLLQTRISRLHRCSKLCRTVLGRSDRTIQPRSKRDHAGHDRDGQTSSPSKKIQIHSRRHDRQPRDHAWNGQNGADAFSSAQRPL